MKLSTSNFSLKRPVEIAVEVEPDGYILSNEKLNVHAFGETFAEARAEWEHVLVNLYLCYRDTADDELTAGGKMLKDHLQSYVGENECP